MNMGLLLRLLVAHILADFILQPHTWAKNKEKNGLRSWHLYAHILIVAIVTFILTWNLSMWPIVLFIVLSHFVIDATKAMFTYTGIGIFFVDQGLHLIVIILAWLHFTNQFEIFTVLTVSFAHKPMTWAILLACIVQTQPASVLIARITERWHEQLSTDGNYESLKDAGKFIGMLERLLILAAILSNRWELIGFLLGAKSVFRFQDLRNPEDRKTTEYIIIGTLLSFFIAIFTGVLLNLYRVI